MEKKLLSNVEIFFLIVQTQIGIGVLSLPNTLQNSSGNDGWISVLLAGAILQLFLLLYWLLLRRFPTLTITQITTTLLGKYVGTFINFVFYLYFILSSTLVLIIFVKLLKEWLLTITPAWMLTLLILLTCLYLTVSSLQIIARFFVLVSALILLLIIISFMSVKLPMDIQNLFPLGSSGIKNILIGTHDSIFLSLYGFEVALFLYPYARHKKRTFLKTISLANLFVTALSTYFVFLCIMIFSDKLLSQVDYPVLFFLRALEFQFIDRIDQIFIAIWIVPMMMSIVMYTYLASKCISISNKKQPTIVIINTGFIFFLSLLARKDDLSINLYSMFLKYVSYGMLFCLPILLLLLSFLRKETGEKT
ncbi:GerAB/ArcD/ProY family transporter [Bacillus hwajinpoensis]|uniref:GerAB/ArcD/ProY family transporter n=1 Tax=Guptibacillus hwajinpoensis TaxID=208199 RepID=A0A845F112_9BACL|nr:GerAB/ArcD/ProY family transporter [Pseudalkalibacillus hwajinpoensis]MYL64491.1 GerAB/ArcD/ProY family transporter [Pseudalkalibacillus hwajinpoensis]